VDAEPLTRMESCPRTLRGEKACHAGAGSRSDDLATVPAWRFFKGQITIGVGDTATARSIRRLYNNVIVIKKEIIMSRLTVSNPKIVGIEDIVKLI